MKSRITINNDMPESITIEGKFFSETHSLTVPQLIPFIERDIYRELKAITIGKNDFEIQANSENGLYEIKILINVQDESAKWLLTPKLESILWSYNQQILMHYSGELRPLPTRYTFLLEFKKAVRSEESNKKSRGLMCHATR